MRRRALLAFQPLSLVALFSVELDRQPVVRHRKHRCVGVAFWMKYSVSLRYALRYFVVPMVLECLLWLVSVC